MTSSDSKSASNSKAPSDRHIYHMTHISNLPSIIEHQALLCSQRVTAVKASARSIAYDTLQAYRHNTRVPIGPGGLLHDYVPFYFCSKTPMLYAIHMGKAGGGAVQNDIVFFITSPGNIAESRLPFVFTDGHAIMAYSKFFEDLRDLEQVDWALMQKKYWVGESAGSDATRRRQAEFLVHQQVPLAGIRGIAVFGEPQEEVVQKMLDAVNVTLLVKAIRQLYFD